MRRRNWLLGAIGATALALTWGAFAAPRLADFPGSKAAGSTEVDVELVLAIDISYSMDFDEMALQREGYAQAIASQEFLNALKQGTNAKVAVTLVEWAGVADQRIVVPWRLIDGSASAQAVSDEITRSPVRRAFRTSISGALMFSAALFEGNGFRGIRRVIDVSGDGTNNQGPLVTLVRDEVLAKGIVINGLPIMLKEPQPGSIDIKELDIYYEDCVIGGPGAFVIPIREREKFKDAIRTKLVLDIAQYRGEARVIPASAEAPRISCTIGEQMWQRRWGGGGIDWR
jgi:Protein of unknown function (DUF1194)